MNGFQLRIIEKAIENDHVLSAWESDFIASLDDLPESQELTTKQNHVLNNISEKI